MSEENKKKQKENRALAMIAPNAIKVKINDTDVFVASDRDENCALNMVVAAQLRAVLQAHLKMYKDKDRELTPKELKELTEAAKNISDFSGMLYEGGANLNDKSGKEEKTAEKVDTIDAISFESVGKPEETKEEPNDAA